MAFSKPQSFDILGFIKQNFWRLVLVIYIVLSFIFIVNYLYSTVLVGVFNNGVEQGKQIWAQDVISQIVTQVSQSNCQPVNIPFAQWQSLGIVNVSCMTPAQPTQ